MSQLGEKTIVHHNEGISTSIVKVLICERKRHHYRFDRSVSVCYNYAFAFSPPIFCTLGKARPPITYSFRSKVLIGLHVQICGFEGRNPACTSFVDHYLRVQMHLHAN